MKREPIILVVVLLILSLMTYNLMQQEAPRAPRVSGGKALEAFQMPLSNPVVALPAQGSRRDLLRRPSADEPLDALQLPDPSLAPLGVLMPPPIPDSGASYWSEHLFAANPTILGGLDDLVDAGSNGTDLLGLDQSVADTFSDQDDQYRKVYDWVRLNPLATFYGYLLGDGRFDYVKGDTLRFKQVDPYTGRERAELEFDAEEYEGFGFADTLHNQIELGVRDQRTRMSAARVQDLGVFVHWLLDQGLAEPIAFGYADELARDAVRLAPDDVTNWMLLGEVWERTFDLDRAFALYAMLAGENLGETLPDFGLTVEKGRFARSAGPRVRMGVILRRIGLDADSEVQFRAAVDLASGDANAPMELGLLMLDLGRVEEGRQLLTRAMGMQGQRNSKSALRNAVALGEASMRSGNWSEANQAFLNAERAAGNNKAAAMRAQSGLIASTYLSGDFSGARALAGTAIDNFGANAGLLYLRGIAEAADGGAAGEVIRDLRASAAATPFDAAPALSAQAFWLDRIGETDAAQEALASALELSPRHLYSRYLQVHWAARDGDLEGARLGLQDLVRTAPVCAGILAEFADLLYTEASYGRAEVAFRSLEEAFPDWVRNTNDAPAWAGVVMRHGLNLLHRNLLEDAMSAFDQALSMDPSLNAARNAKGMVLYQEGDLDAAVAEFAYLQDTLRESEDDLQFIYAATWQDRVLSHAKMRRWVDSFDGRRLRPGWDTQTGARAGVEPRLENQSLLIQGEHSGAAETSAYYTVPGLAFRDFVADLHIENGHRGDAAAYIALQNRNKETWSFRVIRDREGAIGWSMMRGTRPENGQTAYRLAEGETARISFHVNREPKQPILTVRFNDEVIYSEAVSSLRNPTGVMASGLLVRTALALPVDASLDNVELIYAVQ